MNYWLAQGHNIYAENEREIRATVESFHSRIGRNYGPLPDLQLMVESLVDAAEKKPNVEHFGLNKLPSSGSGGSIEVLVVYNTTYNTLRLSLYVVETSKFSVS